LLTFALGLQLRKSQQLANSTAASLAYADFDDKHFQGAEKLYINSSYI
jgi:hypothetical protein